jgi:hypothetical protein
MYSPKDRLIKKGRWKWFISSVIGISDKMSETNCIMYLKIERNI